MQNTEKFIKDPKSGAVLNTDTSALELYRLKKNAAKTAQQRLNTLEGKVESISSDLSDIKTMLQAILGTKS